MISRALCARRGCRSGRARCSTRSRRCRAVGITEPRAISTGHCTRCSSTGRTSGRSSTRRSTSSGAIPICLKKMMALVLPEIAPDRPRRTRRRDGAPPRRGAAPQPATAGPRARGGRNRDRRGHDLFRPRSSCATWISRRCRSTSWRGPRPRSRGCACRCRIVPTRRFAPDPRGARADHARDVAGAAALGRPDRAKAQKPRAAGRRRWSFCATSRAR